MAEFLVIWRDDDQPIQSRVETDTNPATMGPDDWVELAALSEDYTIEDTTRLFQTGYDLYAVIKGPVEFVY